MWLWLMPLRIAFAAGASQQASRAIFLSSVMGMLARHCTLTLYCSRPCCRARTAAQCSAEQHAGQPY